VAFPDLEFEQVTITILDGGRHVSRAERIGRLTFDRLRGVIEREGLPEGRDMAVARLEPDAVQVNLDTMDDEAVADAGAAAIYRSLSARQHE
jgi:hypothetical protein